MLSKSSVAEYRSLLLYVAIVAFKGVLNQDEYNVLLYLFCAVCVMETNHLLKQPHLLKLGM